MDLDDDVFLTEDSELLQVDLIWRGKTYCLELSMDSTVGDLKDSVSSATGVLRENQAITGLSVPLSEIEDDGVLLRHIDVTPFQHIYLQDDCQSTKEDEQHDEDLELARKLQEEEYNRNSEPIRIQRDFGGLVSEAFPPSIDPTSPFLQPPLSPLLSSSPSTARDALLQVLESMSASHGLTQKLESIYGQIHPRLHTGSIDAAVLQAREEFKLLLIYLHEAGNADCHQFCSHVLFQHIFAELIDENFIMWVGEASQTQQECLHHLFGVKSTPFLAVLVHQNGVLRVLKVLSAKPELDIVLEQLITHVQDNEGHLQAARTAHEERQAHRSLLREQDSAFQESLLMDQHKERLAQMEKEETERALQASEQAEREKRERDEREREKKRQRLPEEPQQGEAGSTHVMVRLPDGKKLSRRFRLTEPIQLLFDWLDLQGVIEGGYKLSLSYPRKQLANCEATFEQENLFPQAMLLIQPEDM